MIEIRGRMSYYMSRLFPKCNSSFALTKGNALKAQVVRLNEDKFLVDSGIGPPKICKKEELTGVPHRSSQIRFENKVGFMDLVSRESLIKEKILERFFIDLVAGESAIKERAAARFNDLVGSTDGVPGEPHILLPRRFRQYQVWMELKKIWRTNSKVKGFVVEKMKSGYSVAIAGHIAFLPFRPGVRKRISDHRFTIQSINPKTMNIVLS